MEISIERQRERDKERTKEKIGVVFNYMNKDQII